MSAPRSGSVSSAASRGSRVAVERARKRYRIVDEIEAAGCVPKLVHAPKAKLMMGMINKVVLVRIESDHCICCASSSRGPRPLDPPPRMIPRARRQRFHSAPNLPKSLPFTPFITFTNSTATSGKSNPITGTMYLKIETTIVVIAQK